MANDVIGRVRAVVKSADKAYIPGDCEVGCELNDLHTLLAVAEAARAMFAAGRASHEALSAQVDVQRRMDATSAQWRIDYETAASLSIAADARFHEAHAALRTAVAALDAPPTT